MLSAPAQGAADTGQEGARVRGMGAAGIAAPWAGDLRILAVRPEPGVKVQPDRRGAESSREARQP